MSQMLLHDPDEVALMKDLGFAVGPGTHAFVGVKQTQVNPHTNQYKGIVSSQKEPYDKS